jgi:hypothetical protein
MRTWKAEYRGRWGGKSEVNVAAKTFHDAIKRVKVAARKVNGDRRPRITSLVQTAILDA